LAPLLFRQSSGRAWVSYVNVPKDLAARRRSCEENLNQLRKEWLSEHVRVCSEFQHDSPYSRVGAPPGLSPCKLSFGSESIQTTSILGKDCPYYVVLLHYKFSMWD
jgi:hypothetical protein